MDAYVSKPVRTSELFEPIERRPRLEPTTDKLLTSANSDYPRCKETRLQVAPYLGRCGELRSRSRAKLSISAENHLQYASLEQIGELFGRHWSAEIVSLPLVAKVSLKKFQLLLRFHTLRNDPQLKASAHADYRRHDGGLVGSSGDLTDKRLINLQGIDREFPQITQAGVTRAEIIDGNRHAAGS